MAMLKCKMCGGNLEVSEGTTVCECEYCGTKQTVPKAQDDVTANLFNRANNLRIKCEFDKAQEIYEKIVSANPNESEAYWGIVLCKFGIEYVEDPATFKKIPTCHRTQLESVQTDVDYKAAIDNADSVQRSLYESEAAEIDRLQRDILAIVHNEEPFDVFICYKETDENGKRTNDSVIANDIYHQLTQEGFKVFYAAITLEDKLGQAYEPYIFAALTSAKVMLAIGSKPEYFNAVWVKNEWSRYLKIMKNDRSKLLIPCYKDMDAYDLPEEFSHLQAQDMSKIGFINDVIRGIKKVVAKEEPKPEVKETVVVQQTFNATIVPLLKRAFMFLEDGEWTKADDFCEQVLNLDPECAEAYLGKLMAELEIRTRDNLKNCDMPFDNTNNYDKAYKFADEVLKNKLTDDNRFIRERNEIARKEGIYNKACVALQNTIQESECHLLAKEFESIKDYKDSAEKINECEEKAIVCHKDNIYRLAMDSMSEDTIDSLGTAIKELTGISDWKDSAEKIKKCEERIVELEEKAIVCHKDNIYRLAMDSMSEDTIDSLGMAIKELTGISDWKDSAEKIEKCKERIAELEEEKRLNEEKGERDRIAAEKALKKKKKVTAIVMSCVTVCFAFVIILNTVIVPSNKYNEAVLLMNDGRYHEAIGILGTIRNYKDSGNLIMDCSSHLPKNSISGGNMHTIGLKSDGTVVAAGYNEYGQCDVSEWKDIASISGSDAHTVGLKSDGTVVAAGDNYNGKCDVSEWKDIASISCSYAHTVGLKSDGTVVAAGDNEYGQCDVSKWTDIIAISSGGSHTVGLKSDGTVVAAGYNEYGQCDVSDWKDIIAISSGGGCHTVGLKSDGTVVAAGYNGYGQCDVSDWKDIIAISVTYFNTVGLKSDGTVVAAGYNEYGQCDVSDWKDIIAISVTYYKTVGLKSDGTVVAAGDNKHGQCDVSDWKNIKTSN